VVRSEHHRAAGQRGAPGQRRGHIRHRVGHRVGQPGRVRGQRRFGACRDDPRHHVPREQRRCRFSRGFGDLLQDQVGVGAADPERRHPGPARTSRGGPLTGLGQQLDRTGRPIDLGRRLGHVQRLRQDTVPHGLHHLDHPGDTRRALGVADVGLHRAHPQRPVAVLPVGRQQRLRFDRVTQTRSGAVGFHRVDICGRETRIRQRDADNPLLCRTVRRGQAVRRAVLVHRRTLHHREHPMPETTGLGKPLQQDQADALAEARPVRSAGERLAPGIAGEPLLAAEVDVQARRRQHRHAPGECQVALASTQCLRRKVNRHQRRRARRVHGQCRALETQRVRHPARGDAARIAGQPVAVEFFGIRPGAGRVLLVDHARVDADGAARVRGGIDARVFERFPGGFQQDPLLRVHRQCLTRADPEEGRVESGGVIEERALADVRLPGPAGVRVVQAADVPAAVVRERGDRVGTGGDQVPQVFRGSDPAGEAAPHSDDGDRFLHRSQEPGVVLLEQLVFLQ
jgi:hypothetical protein